MAVREIRDEVVIEILNIAVQLVGQVSARSRTLDDILTDLSVAEKKIVERYKNLS